jgi:hypothetical protein
VHDAVILMHMASPSDSDFDLENGLDEELDGDISSLKSSLRRQLFRGQVSSLLSASQQLQRGLHVRRTEENTNCGVEYIKAFRQIDTNQSVQKEYVVTILKSLGASISPVSSHQWLGGRT